MQIDALGLGASSGLLDTAAHGTTAAAGTTIANGATQIKKAGDTSDVFGLGRDDFFKLFLAQLKNQDPTQPVDDKEFIAQLAQFTMIDTLKALEKTSAGTQLAQASSLIGKSVTGTGVDGAVVSGVVESLLQDTDGIALIVGGKAIRPESVSIVTPPDPARTGTAATAADQAGSTTPTTGA